MSCANDRGPTPSPSEGKTKYETDTWSGGVKPTAKPTEADIVAEFHAEYLVGGTAQNIAYWCRTICNSRLAPTADVPAAGRKASACSAPLLPARRLDRLST